MDLELKGALQLSSWSGLKEKYRPLNRLDLLPSERRKRSLPAFDLYFHKKISAKIFIGWITDLWEKAWKSKKRIKERELKSAECQLHPPIYWWVIKNWLTKMGHLKDQNPPFGDVTAMIWKRGVKNGKVLWGNDSLSAASFAPNWHRNN